MDPDDLLNQIRHMEINRQRTIDDGLTMAAGAIASDIADLVRNLDQWLSKGGILPRAWQSQTTR